MKPRFEEVSDKIKEAIKVKLIELGAYVDDELADYIIVMLANKKSQQSMTEDLSLFLGTNTEKFTSWLTGLLRKLQLISDEASVTRNKPTETETMPVDREPVKRGQSEVFSGHDPAKDKKQQNTAEQQSTTNKHASSEPEINIYDEKDDFDDVLDGKVSQKVSNNSSSSSIQSSKRGSEKPNVDAKRSLERKIPTSRVEDRPLPGPTLTKVSPTKTRESEPTKPPSRKRSLVSAIGAVLQNDDEDDSSDVVHHSVASAVSIKPRKSSVPVGRQATTSLLMKAINDAEGSLEKRRKKSLSSDDHAPREVPRDAREYLAGNRKPKLRLTEDETLDSSEKIVISVANKSGRGSKGAELSAESAIGWCIADLHSGSACETNSDKEGSELTAEDHAHMAVHSVLKKSSTGSKQMQPQMVFTDEVDDDAVSTALPEGSDASGLLPANDSNTKFVITLNGVDEDSMVGVSEKEGRNVGRVKPQRHSSASQEVSIVVGEDNDEDMEEEESKNSARTSERCKYWPNCKNGSDCSFYHPTIQCKFFPRCQFGSKCMNIHPQCKFDGACTRPNCPYLHSGKPLSAPTLPFIIQPLQVPVYPSPRSFTPSYGGPAASKVQCKFYPNCSNPSCPFSHPKPCRYGNGCMQKDTCPFEHPRFPTKEQLNWTASKADVPLAKVTATDN